MNELQQHEISRSFEILLQKNPIILARSEQFICPIPQLFFYKIYNGAYFDILDSEKILQEKEKDLLGTSIGKAFEEYGTSIAQEFAEKRSWEYKCSPEHDGVELTDCYLQNNKVGIMIEFKAGRPGLPFMIGQNDDRVLGPSREFFINLDGDTCSLKKIKKADRAYLTKGIWQMNTHIQNMKIWAKENFKEEPTRIFLLMVVLSPYIPDKCVIKGYIKPLIEKIQGERSLIIPHYLHIRDFEALFELGIKDAVDPTCIIEYKELEDPECRFEAFLKDVIKEYPTYSKLVGEYEYIVKKLKKDFFS